MNMNDGPIQVLKKNDQTSEAEEEWELEQLTRVEINRQTDNERWLSDELKKIEKETEDRKSELERLRVAVHELEEAKRLMKAEEEEIAQLKRALSAVKKDNRQSNKIRARPSEKQSSREEDGVDSEEAVSEKEEEQPMRRSSKVKKNASGSLKRWLVAVEDFTDDDEEDLHSMSMRNAEARRIRSEAIECLASCSGDGSRLYGYR
jgi:hypothetical protein